VDTGFACWPFFLRDPWPEGLRGYEPFELLVTSLKAKYPDLFGAAVTGPQGAASASMHVAACVRVRCVCFTGMMVSGKILRLLA